MKHLPRRCAAALLTLALLLSLAPAARAAGAAGQVLREQSSRLHDGTVLVKNVLWSESAQSLRREHIVLYEPNGAVKPIVDAGSSVTSLESVTSAARRLEAEGYRVLAGINGDYFGVANGVPLGTTMTGGVLRNASPEHYAVGFRDNGEAVIGAPQLTMRVRSERGSFDLAAINQVRYTYGGVYLYTSDFNPRHTTSTNEPGLDVICTAEEGELTIGGTLRLRVARVEHGVSNTVIREGEYVLTANLLAGEAALAPLRECQVGDELTLTVRAKSAKWNSVREMVGALYLLVEDGVVCAGLEPGGAPRTAVGVREDGKLVLYTVDGRQSGWSAGLTLRETAERMAELGCVTAVSLDGGGSTTLVASTPAMTASALVNRPSDGYARAVTDRIFLVASNQPSSVLRRVHFELDETYILPYASLPLAAAAVDDNYLPAAVPVSFSADDGTVENDWWTAPPRAGTVTLTARAGNRTAKCEITVVDTPDEIAITRNGERVERLTLTPDETVALDASAMLRHLPVAARNGCFDWRADGVGYFTAPGVLTASSLAASGSITVSVGAAAVTIPVSVVTRPFVTLDDFETAAPDPFVRDSAREHVGAGRASARLDYAAGAAEVPLSYAVPRGYDRLSVLRLGGETAVLTFVTDAGECELLGEDGARLFLPLPEGATALTSLRVEAAAPGALWLDQLTAAFGDAPDTEPPYLTLAADESGALRATIVDAVDGLTLAPPTLTCDGKPLAYDLDRASGVLTARLPDDELRHRVSLTARDASGNLARVSLDRIPAWEAPAFPDTDGHWSNGAVSYLRRAGVANGNDLGNYDPDANLSRQEFATLLYRYLAPAEDFSAYELPFADADAIAFWAVDGVRAMAALGVTNGIRDAWGNLIFDPAATITRAEVVTMLGRLLERGYDVSAVPFDDADLVPIWAAEHVAALASLGALDGGGFRPLVPMTRAEVAALLYKML